MAHIDELLSAALKVVGNKPDDKAAQKIKKRYSEQLSERIALAYADELRRRGLSEARPAAPGELGGSGAERRMAGGIGAKKVDVTWATEESGLLLGISIKTISFRDGKTKNFQKNLTNRRGDMLIEAVTLHRRFPYAVLAGLLFLDKGSTSDETKRRRSTFHNAHSRLKLFTGRRDPFGRDEQYERLYVLTLQGSAFHGAIEAFEAGKPDDLVPLEAVLGELIQLVADRNPDFYEYDNGCLRRVNS